MPFPAIAGIMGVARSTTAPAPPWMFGSPVKSVKLMTIPRTTYSKRDMCFRIKAVVCDGRRCFSSEYRRDMDERDEVLYSRRVGEGARRMGRSSGYVAIL